MSSARLINSDQTLAARPYSVLLASATASSGVRKRHRHQHRAEDLDPRAGRGRLDVGEQRRREDRGPSPARRTSPGRASRPRRRPAPPAPGCARAAPAPRSRRRRSPCRAADRRGACRAARFSLSMKASWMPSWTRSREPAQQTWPWLNQIASTTPSTAESRSASSKTMNGDLPPSSSVSDLPEPAVASRIFRPTSVEPVKAILSMPGC